MAALPSSSDRGLMWRSTPPPRTVGQQLVDSLLDQQAKDIDYWRQACVIRDENLRDAYAEIRRLRREHEVRVRYGQQIRVLKQRLVAMERQQERLLALAPGANGAGR